MLSIRIAVVATLSLLLFHWKLIGPSTYIKGRDFDHETYTQGLKLDHYTRPSLVVLNIKLLITKRSGVAPKKKKKKRSRVGALLEEKKGK